MSELLISKSTVSRSRGRKTELFSTACRRLATLTAGIFLALISPANSGDECGLATTIDVELQKALPAKALAIGKITVSLPHLKSRQEVQDTQIFGSIFARALGEAVKRSTGGVCRALPKSEFPNIKLFLFSSSDVIDKEYCWTALKRVTSSNRFNEQEFHAAKEFFASNSLSRTSDGRFHVVIKEHDLAYAAFLKLYAPDSVIASLLKIEREQIEDSTYTQFDDWSRKNKFEICLIDTSQVVTAVNEVGLIHRNFIRLNQSSGEIALTEVGVHRRTFLLIRIDAKTYSSIFNSVCRRRVLGRTKWPAFRRLTVSTVPRCSSLSLFYMDAWLMFEIPSEALLNPDAVMLSLRKLQSRIQNAGGGLQTVILVRS
jgi:hypothetical protein